MFYHDTNGQRETATQTHITRNIEKKDEAGKTHSLTHTKLEKMEETRGQYNEPGGSVGTEQEEV